MKNSIVFFLFIIIVSAIFAYLMHPMTGYYAFFFFTLIYAGYYKQYYHWEYFKLMNDELDLEVDFEDFFNNPSYSPNFYKLLILKFYIILPIFIPKLLESRTQPNESAKYFRKKTLWFIMLMLFTAFMLFHGKSIMEILLSVS